MRIAPEFLERLLTSDNPIEAIHQLDSFWCARPGRSASQACFGLSGTEFVVHLYLLYLAEVGNGGHCQLFLNQAGDHAPAMLEALARLGLLELRSILLEACAVFPGGAVPPDATSRENVIVGFSEQALSRWSMLDKRLYSVDGASWAKVLAYVRDHRDDVLVLETS